MNPIVKLATLSLSLSVVMVVTQSNTTQAQITTPRILSASQVRKATLAEYLINRLKATTEEQKNYVREIIRLVNTRKLDLKVVLAMERYAQRRSPFYPLPFFERALKVEAAKKGVTVPMIKEMVATNSPLGPRPISRSDTRIRR